MILALIITLMLEFKYTCFHKIIRLVITNAPQTSLFEFEMIKVQCFRRDLGWPVFAYLHCDGLEWIDRVVFGAASSAARAREKCPPRETAITAEKFVP